MLQRGRPLEQGAGAGAGAGAGQDQVAAHLLRGLAAVLGADEGQPLPRGIAEGGNRARDIPHCGA